MDKNLEKKIIIIIIIIITLRTFTNDMITLELWLFFWPNMNKRKHQMMADAYDFKEVENWDGKDGKACDGI